MIAMLRKRQALKELVESAAMPRKNADKIREAERRQGVRMEVQADGNEILLYDVIDSWGGWWGVSASEFREALAELGEAEEITLHLNSPGGEVTEGMAIHNMLVDHPANVTVIVDGMAASIASIVAMAGDDIRMNRGAEMMIHKAWMVTVGDSDFHVKSGDLLDRTDRQMAAIYAARAGGDIDQWLEAMGEESWYLGAEAVEAGLADSSAPLKTKNDDSSPSALWDRSLFNSDASETAGGEPTDDVGAPEDSDQAGATAPDVEERQRALQVVTQAQLAAAGVPVGRH